MKKRTNWRSREAFERLPLFIASMSRWDNGISSASLALAKVFSRTNEVFYIDYPFTVADVLRERKSAAVQRRMPALLRGRNFLNHIPGQPENLMCATPRMVLPFYSLPEGRLSGTVMHWNNTIVASMVKSVLKERKIKDYIFINSFNPSYLSHINRYLDPALSVYHSRDAIEEIKPAWVDRENECVAHYDMAMATSRQLCRNIAARTNRTVHYFPNGGDITLFRTAITGPLPRPPELANITTPIIGYTGAVCLRIDYVLLVKIARAHADKTIVLVGPRDDKAQTDINLDAIPNIVFTGPKKIEELPAYLQYFDCAIIPFKYNNLTAGIYPLKINEYLGAGRQVVTTSFSEDIASFGPYVYLARTHDEFLGQLQQALGNNTRERQEECSAAAAGNAWEHRVETFWQLAWAAYSRKAGETGIEPGPGVNDPIHHGITG